MAAGPRPALVIARDTCESIARVIGVVGLRFGVWPLASAVASRARADPPCVSSRLTSTLAGAWQRPVFFPFQSLPGSRIHTGNACCRELYTAHVWYVQCSERTVGLFYILTLILTYITQIDPVLTRGGTTTSGVVSDPVSTVTSTVRDVSGGKREASCALLALFSGRPIG